MTSRRDSTLLAELQELIAALDRRVPRLERGGERAIARDAARLKAAALERIAELEPDADPPAAGAGRRGAPGERT